MLAVERFIGDQFYICLVNEKKNYLIFCEIVKIMIIINYLEIFFEIMKHREREQDGSIPEGGEAKDGDGH